MTRISYGFKKSSGKTTVYPIATLLSCFDFNGKYFGGHN